MLNLYSHKIYHADNVIKTLASKNKIFLSILFIISLIFYWGKKADYLIVTRCLSFRWATGSLQRVLLYLHLIRSYIYWEMFLKKCDKELEKKNKEYEENSGKQFSLSIFDFYIFMPHSRILYIHQMLSIVWRSEY